MRAKFTSRDVAQLAVEILNLIDDHSRLAIASRFRPTVSSHDFVDVLTDAFNQ